MSSIKARKYYRGSGKVEKAATVKSAVAKAAAASGGVTADVGWEVLKANSSFVIVRSRLTPDDRKNLSVDRRLSEINTSSTVEDATASTEVKEAA